MTLTVNRRARALALLLATVCAGASTTTGLALNRSTGSSQYTSTDAVWIDSLQVGLSLALAWACLLSVMAYRCLGNRREPTGRGTRLLASALLTLAAWSIATPGASAVEGSPAVVATATVEGTTIPSPDLWPAGPPRTESQEAAPEPGWTPTPPPATAPADRSPLLMPSTGPPDRSVTVRRGDSLWAIVGRHLGPSATAAEIASWIPAWHSTNREVIGDDPDLLIAGQALAPPTTNSTVTQGDPR